MSRTETPGDAVDYEKFLDCVHCGLCTAACPTYVELGNENDSPRGRIYLMRAVTDQRIDLTPQVERHLELCLDCRACETACPSGVAYGQLIEPFRVAMHRQKGNAPNWFTRYILLGLFPYATRLKSALRLARWGQQWGLDRIVMASGLLRVVPRELRQLVEMLPRVPSRQPPFPRILPAIGKRRARVALFTGCVSDAMFGPTNWATARVLQQNGCDVVTPTGQVCCGAIHYHAGHEGPARQLAEQNRAAFEACQVDAVVVNVAGCGAMLKDYRHHWPHQTESDRDENARLGSFSDSVRDVHEFLDDLGLVAPTGPLPGRATYHDACHLVHAQKIRDAPRRLLGQIPELEWIELPESELCCGAAGTYNLTEPEMANRLGKRKLENIRRTRADIVVTANAGCLLQIGRNARRSGHRMRLYHPIDLLDLSYRGGWQADPPS